jgi:hypothetical protein
MMLKSVVKMMGVLGRRVVGWGRGGCVGHICAGESDGLGGLLPKLVHPHPLIIYKAIYSENN